MLGPYLGAGVLYVRALFPGFNYVATANRSDELVYVTWLDDGAAEVGSTFRQTPPRGGVAARAERIE